MSRTASNWFPNVAAPDLSNVLRTAGRAGADAGYNEFMAELLKDRKEAAEARKDQRDERNAAARDLGDEPESEGFWQKLGQAAGDGLMRTIDVLSRFNYGSANAMKHLTSQDDDSGEESNFWQKIGKLSPNAIALEALTGKNPVDWIDDVRPDDVFKTGEAWARGFTGKDKTTFAQVIKQNAKTDGKKNRYDNSWYQGIAGFTGDVLLDPTTYIGVGIVSKPFKKGAEKALPDSVKPHAKDLWEFAGKAETLGLKYTDDAGKTVNLTRDNIYSALGGPVILKTGRNGRAHARQASRVKGTRNYINNYQIVRNAIKASSKDNTSSVSEDIARQMSKELDDLKVARDNALAKYGQDAYKRALQDYARLTEKQSPVGPAVKVAAKVTSTFEDSLDVTRVARAISETNMWSATRKRGFKSADANDFDTPSVKEAFLREQEEVFDKALNGAWLSDPRITPEFRATVFQEVERIARQHPKYRAKVNEEIYGTGGLKAQEKALRAAVADARKRKDWDDVRKLNSQLVKVAGRKGDPEKGIEPVVGALQHAWEDVNNIKANIFLRLLGHEIGDPRFANPLMGQYDELVALERELIERTKGLESRASGTVDDFDESLKEAVEQLKQVRRQKAEMINSEEWVRKSDPVELPEGAPKDAEAYVELAEDGTVTLRSDLPESMQGVGQEVLREVQTRQAVNRNQLIRTWTREERAKRAPEAKLPDEALAQTTPKSPKIKGKRFLPFGGKNRSTPQVLLDGKPILRNEKASRDALLDKATREDWAKAEAEWRAGNPHAPETVGGKLDDNGNWTPEFADELQGLEQEADVFFNLGKAKARGPATTPLHVIVFDRLFEEQFGTSVGAALKARKTAAMKYPQADWSPKIPDKTMKEFNDLAYERAVKFVSQDLADGKLEKVVGDVRVDLQGVKTMDEGVATADDAAAAHAVAVRETKEEYARRIAAEKTAAPRGNTKTAKLNERIKQLEEARDYELSLLSKALKESEKASEAMLARMDEQVTLNMLEEATMSGANYLRLNFAGAKLFDLPVPTAMTKATEKIGGLPILQATHKAFSEAFSPASKLEPELNLARLRAQARTPDIIKHHVDDIRSKFVKYHPSARKAALESIRKGAPVGDPQLVDEMSKFFEDFLPYVQGQVTIADEPLEIIELNRFLPEEFQLVHPTNGNVNLIQIFTPQDLLKVMRNVNTKTDPMQIMWRLKIASEQALANKAMKHTIRSTFGVKRIIPPKRAQAKFNALSPDDVARMNLIEDLKTNHGWVSVRSMGDDYYFPSELAEQIETLDKIIKPAKIHEITRLFDKVLRFWKSTVTVYNPGYYTRNGIGETIMGAMDGVWNAAHYKRSGYILAHAMPDDVQQALKTLEPWKRHETTRQAMSRKVTQRSFVIDGKRQQLTNEDVWVLFHEVGLKTGFISTEFDHYFPTAGSMKASPVGQVATKINDAVRHGGEKYEDFFRLAHFISRLERSKLKDARAAAEDAAKYVRKFHYDYTDFTPFEKSTMMRIFPFYKWTRKSLPLMGSLLFTRPGLVSLYPKAMQNLSYATGGTDPLEDDNGFQPNYEELTPNWIENLMGYPIGEDEESAMTYMNIATPQFDIFKMMQNPVSASIGMMNPMFKVPLEQGMGRTMDPDFSMELEGRGRLDHLLRTTPAGSLASNVLRGSKEGADSAISEPGRSPLDERLTSFLTGLGFYENNEKRQQGEQFRRSMEGK